jgi:drug/metabolite transporter (DMT)-like permease
MQSLTLPIVAALLAVYLFWGGTYLAMKFAIETLPPFTMAGIRFTTAGTIVYLWQIARGSEHPSGTHWKHAAIVGALMLLGGNGGVVWAEQMVPSGIAAVIVATVPLWMALLAWLWQGGRRPTGLTWLGLAVGFLGILLLMKNSQNQTGSYSAGYTGYLALIAASLSWAAGSLYSRTASLPKAPFLAIALQMLTGGLCCLLAGLVTGEWSALDFSKVSPRSALSLGYLIVFGSLVAFSSYIWLLRKADPTMVSTYAYVNPVVAVALGWLLAGEQLAAQDIIATAVIVFSVILITKANYKPAPASSHGNQTKCANIGEEKL